MSITSEQLAELKRLALEARELAHCPYSKFQVGAAILTDSGQYFQGANVENASYGGTICAERTAIVKMVTSGKLTPKIKAVVVATNLPEPCSPCGICRQVIREFAPLSTPIYMLSNDGDRSIVHTLDELLPLSFGPEHLL